MKTKFNGILTLLLAFMVQFTFAQERVISGVVEDDMGPVADISVVVKGTTKGTVTDFDGKYSIKAKKGDTLVFSHISYGTVEKVIGDSNIINAKMSETGETLDAVVVTAQGISTKKKTLGYAVTTIKADDIEGKAESDIARVLTGKIAGVQTQPAGGFLGSGTAVFIRSKTSITGDNRPLYVVDGVPISSDRYQELDANNIKSTSVLKGLAASTLYGEDGRNGVILITTKSGSSNAYEKGFEVSVYNTLVFNKVASLPDFQNKYGQGADQVINTTYFGTWGAEFNGQMVPHHLSIPAYADIFPEFQGALVEYKAFPNNVSDFFKLGVGNNISANISKSAEKYNISFNVGHTQQKGFLEGNNLNRLSLSLGGNTELSNKFKLNTSINFTRTKWEAPRRNMFDLLMYIPRNLDIHNLPYESPVDHSSVYYRVTQNNPLWTLKNAKRNSLSDGVFAKASLTYDINDKYSLTYRSGLDIYNRDRTEYTNKGAANDGKGFMTQVYNRKTILDNVVLFNINLSELSEDFGITGTIGSSLKHEKSRIFGMQSTDQIVYGLIDHRNFLNHDFFGFDPFADFVGPDGTPYEKNTIGVFGDFKFGFKEMIYLTLAARNDWASTVEKENQSLFYPSASLSFIPTTAFDNLKGETLNFLKFRFGYGTSANFPDPYKTRLTLDFSGNAVLDDQGNPIILNSLSSLQPNPDLKPERLSEIEAGIEAKMFNNKLSFDLSVYSRIAKDQILRSSLPPSTGFTSKFINAGRIDTKGFEFGFNLTPLSSDNFKWNLSGNFTAYETTVIDIPVDQINVAFGVNYAVENEPLGVFKGTYMVRDDEGNLLINPSNGKVISSDALGLPDKIIGDPNEKWNSAITNSFTYKNITLSGQIEYRHGGDIYSVTASNLLRRGVTEDTIDREGTFIVPGVLADPNTGDLILDSDGNKIPNTLQIGANDLYFIHLQDIDENLVYDASTFRLRNISLSYAMPSKLLERTPFGSMSFSLNADNLFFYTPNMPKHLHIDPEVVSSNVGNGRGIDLMNEPSQKSYSFTIKLTF
jgi:TonB-linked SusC/RagA family outer membrane protein